MACRNHPVPVTLIAALHKVFTGAENPPTVNAAAEALNHQGDRHPSGDQRVPV
jgi:hypothetical protein